MKLNLKKVLVAAALFCGASLAVGSVNSTFADCADKPKTLFCCVKFEDYKGLNKEQVKEQVQQKFRSEILAVDKSVDEDALNKFADDFAGMVENLNQKR